MIFAKSRRDRPIPRGLITDFFEPHRLHANQNDKKPLNWQSWCIMSMTNMYHVLLIIAPLFLIIFASAVLQRLKLIGENWSQVLNEFALKIGLPVLIFSALSKVAPSFSEQSELIVFNSCFVLGSFLLAYLVGKALRLKKQSLLTLFICLAFSNIAYLGIPVLTQIQGEKILPVASLIVAIYLFWVFTVGTGYLDYATSTNKRNIAKNMALNLVKSPLIIAVVLGILVSLLRITLPAVLIKPLDMITASVTPTVLVVIGLFIGKSTIGKWSDWLPVFSFSVATLIIMPAIFYFSVKLLGYSPSTFSASMIEAAMPLAITPFALADKYNLNKDFIARSIVLSTVLSVISLPFWISILQ